MKSNFPLKFQKHKASGVVRVKIHTPRGSQWLSTGQTSYDKAREVCDRAMVDRLQMAANAGVLNGNAISLLLTGRKFTCADILADWRTEMEMDLAPDTLATYYGILSNWLVFCECGAKPISSVHRHDLHAFVNEPKIAAGNRKGRLAALRSYYKFCNATGRCVGNMAELVRVQTRDLLFAQLESKETLPITEAEYRLLMASPKVPPFWRAATAMGYWLGYRLRDIACYEAASLNAESTIVFQRKTGGRLELSLNDPLLGGGELHSILLDIVANTPPGSPYCFPEKREIALNPKRRANLSVTYGKILVRHGIEGKRFHGLRHACAMRLKNAGLTFEDIAKRLGHASTSATEIYTTH
jgi:integrase